MPNDDRLPRDYPSEPASKSRDGRHDEPPVEMSDDRAPTFRWRPGDSPADTRIAVERLLRHREGASEAAWRKLGPAARSVLVDLLTDGSVMREEAMLHRVIGAVGKLSVKRAIAPLVDILRDASARDVTRTYAAAALGRIGEPAAIAGLASVAGDRSDMLRRQVAKALGRIESVGALPHLLGLRDDPSPAVVEVVERALAAWDDRVDLSAVRMKPPPEAARERPRKRGSKVTPAEET